MSQTEQKKIFNVGVVGYGMSAQIFHIPFITTTSTFKLHSILQRNPTASPSSAPHDHPNIKHFTSLDPFLSDPELDVVVLSTTPDTHFPLAKQALNAGKHVFVEKPFVPSSSEAEELIRLSEERNRKICVYQNRRWDSDFLTVRKLIADGALGRIIEFETHFDRYRAAKPTTWKGELSLSQGGSALYDLGTHLVDQAYVLFGMPRGVFAKLVSQRDGRVRGPEDPDVEPDSVNMQLFYDGGLIVHVRIGVMSAEVRQPRFWIRGTKGSYHKAGLDPQEDQLKAGMKTTDAQFGRDSEEWHGRLVTVGEDEKMSEETCPNVEPVTYRQIYELFGESLSGKGPVPVSASEARDVLRILEAAKESAMSRSEIDLS
ncbi:oxidoreductase family protein [Xylariaceae sp. AK1471]|nr:oxidoreductase family protein [Xylariaceae sp. AK1471]